MGHYILTGRNLTLGTGSVLAAVQTAAAGSAGANLRITRIEVGQKGTTTQELFDLEWAKRDTAGTLTTTAATPVNALVGGPAGGLTGSTSVIGGTGRAGVNSSADATGTYSSNRYFPGNNNLVPFLWKPDPKEEIWIPPSTVWVLRFSAAPSGTTGWGVSIEWEEF